MHVLGWMDDHRLLSKYVMKYKSPTTPMKHQRQYMQRVAERPSVPSDEDVMAVQGEMGTGKSKMVIDEWQEMVGRNYVQDLLVIAPAGSYTNWFQDKSDAQLSEMKLHLDPRLYEKTTIGAWISGGGKAVRAQLDKMLKATGPRALFVNIEAMSTVEKAEEITAEFLSRGQGYFAVDESTRIKSGKAQRTKTIIRQLKPLAKVRRIMTGWITPNSPLDLYWQFYFLDWKILGFETPLGFRNRYAVTEKRCFLPNEVIRARLTASMGVKKGESSLPDERLRGKLTAVREHLEQDFSTVAKMPRDVLVRKLEEEATMMRRDDMVDLIPKLGGYVQVVEKIKSFQNLEELSKKIAPYSHRVLKKDCLDLKPKIYMTRDVQMTAQQRRMYEEIKRYATSEIMEDEHVTADSVIVQMIRLHQIVCGHAVSEDGDIVDVESRRIPELLELLEEHEGKAIIWATYQHEIRKIAAAIKEVYGPRSTGMFYGGNRKARVQEEKNFLSEKECRFMVSTQSAGGVGNNWTVANLVVYAANSYDLELRVQSEDRTHRKGQLQAVTYVDLTCRDTVEEKIVQALRKKIDLTTVINGENFREWLI